MSAVLSRGKSLALTMALGLLLSLGLAVGTATPAAAAGTFRLCNVSSNYTAYADFGSFTTFVVNPGQCTSTGLNASYSSYSVTIRGTWANSAYKTTRLYPIPAGRSVDFHAGGSFAAPQFTPLVY
ncbi:hypothetical protein AB0M72_21455 [Nocardiopsis dassonvillei]|uniref:hypothetical protein n=1 Tax=Nocardiopsis dassonvillei TaxID=2014 RepID=UPI00200BDA5F|nr:hypothetical protein [Nocardiopsis dassonvillei]MCK9869766.1 hypothetical protein [Nocardiopsis dassonvillei]